MQKIYLPPQVEYVINKLCCAGFEAYAVGGCVRDHLMGKTPGDYDVTTSAKPEEMLKVFSSDGTEARNSHRTARGNAD